MNVIEPIIDAPELKAPRRERRQRWLGIAAAAGAALAVSGVINHLRARRAERDNPPLGKFVTVDGVRLHYCERGEGTPLLLVHGNGSMVEDWISSGVFDALAATNRVIALDRPGFGHSERPRGHIWTPAAQAALIAGFIRQIGADRPVVVGHSFGTLVTLALAVDHPHAAARIVLIGGYFYPSARADVIALSPPAIPVIGDAMRYSISPLIGSVMTPVINRKLFGPAAVPEYWKPEFPMEMSLRPSQIRASAAETAMMIPAAAMMAKRYDELSLPVTIIAGSGDRIVDTAAQSERLHTALAGSRLVVVEGAGHMVHHTAPERVVAAILAA